MQKLDPRRQQRLGIALVALSAVAWSTAGYFTRLIQLDPWTMMFWRGAFGGLFIAAFIVWRSGGQTITIFRSLGLNGLFVAICATLSMIPFIPALKLTAVGNVMVINATLPITAALLAWIWLDERVSSATFLGGFMSLCGIAVMMGGIARSANYWGEVLALLMLLGGTLMTVAIRRYREVPLLPVATVASILGALVIWPLADPLAVNVAEIFYLAIFAFVQMALGLAAFSVGSRLITAAQAGLIIALEMPLAVLWVWLTFDERPEITAVIGGIIVIVAVAGHFLIDGCRRLQMRPKY